MRHRDCLNGQRAATKDILVCIETLVKKYNIHPEDYHVARGIVKSRVFRISNVWHQFFATVVDAKFNKRVNEEGAKEETHLDNGEDPAE